MVDGSNESLYHANEEFDPNLCTGVPLQKSFEKVDVSTHALQSSLGFIQFGSRYQKCGARLWTGEIGAHFKNILMKAFFCENAPLSRENPFSTVLSFRK